MSQPIRILLLDIDGVLIQPGGYRAAVRAALNYYLQQMGFSDHQQATLLPDEAVLARFEANRITSEWDMTPITLAILLEEILARLPDLHPDGSLAELLDKVNAARQLQPGSSLDLGDLPYAAVIDRISASLQPGEVPSLAALRLSNHASSNRLFPHLSGSPVLGELISSTRDWRRSPVTRLFQHFTLGSRAFQLFYHWPAEIESPSMIGMHDQTLLTPEQTQALLQCQASGQFHLAAYTLRSSLPPREFPASLVGFSPEAETALEIAGLSFIPLIGYGRLDYLARANGEDISQYIKPSPVQAVAAILAALTHNELDSVIQAREFVFDQLIPAALSTIPSSGLEIHVFEDSRGGIEAAQSATRLLSAVGIPAKLFAWGISADPHKRQALRAVTDRVFESTPEAIQAALGELSSGLDHD